MEQSHPLHDERCDAYQLGYNLLWRYPAATAYPRSTSARGVG